jgi:hypothetical protein
VDSSAPGLWAVWITRGIVVPMRHRVPGYQGGACSAARTTTLTACPEHRWSRAHNSVALGVRQTGNSQVGMAMDSG